MASLVPVVGFVSLLSLWALICCGVYVALRASDGWLRFGVGCFGPVALALWLLGFSFFAVWMRPGGWRATLGLSPQPYPYLFVLALGGALLLSLAGGGLIVRAATQGRYSWWHGVLFCAYYFPASHGVTAMGVIWQPSFVKTLLSLYPGMLDLLSFGPLKEAAAPLLVFFIWTLPLGAPLCEIVTRSFQRAWRTNKSGALT